MRWSKEKAWEWYNARPWLRGCNYMSADCANRTDQWQEYGFEERLATTERELRLMKDTGFNTVRIIPEFIVWKEDHDGFMERLERYLALLDKYGICAMIVLANDCMPPASETWRMTTLGEQKFDLGYHGGRRNSQHGKNTDVGPHPFLDDAALREEYFLMVREIVGKYKDDCRVCVWDVYNEPGNSNRSSITLPVLKRMFETVREILPSQPLTAGVWNLPADPEVPAGELNQYCLDNSDIISYHCYVNYLEHIKIIKRLKSEGRPLLNTEWLGRCFGNDVFSLFPLFYLERIGCYNWGFVAGKYQTYEPWEGTWSEYFEGKATDVDFTKWFHDLYRPNHRPYDPKEIELIKEFCARADADFKRGC